MDWRKIFDVVLKGIDVVQGKVKLIDFLQEKVIGSVQEKETYDVG